MIYEYALEPEMVAAWGTLHSSRFFIREFGLSQGRLVSRYPKSWARRVWKAFSGGSDMDRKRLEELLMRLKETMVKRKDCYWDEKQGSWLENALLEHDRYPFRAILAGKNQGNRPEILLEDELSTFPCAGWDAPHGVPVNRNASEMASTVEMMLARCRWVKFIDPYFSLGKSKYKQSLSAFMHILAAKRPVGPIERVEIHANGDGATADFLKEFYEKIIPNGLTVALFQWQKKPGGQKLHNRYILTDLGGVSFQHGLDIGSEGETDDVNRLDSKQYEIRCRQYDHTVPAFDEAVPPIIITGRRKPWEKG